MTVSRGLAPAVCLLLGCASTGALQTTALVPKGELQLGVEPGVAGLISLPHPYCYPTDPGCTSTYRTGFALGVDYPGVAAGAVLPALGVSLRYGAFESADLSGRLTLSSIDFDAKLLLRRGERLRIAWVPSLGARYILTPSGRIGFAAVPGLTARSGFLFGWTTRRGEAVFGLAPSYTKSFPQSFAVGWYDHFAVSASLGFAFALNRKVQLMPQLEVALPLVATDPTPARLRDRPMLAQLVLGVLVGGQPRSSEQAGNADAHAVTVAVDNAAW